MSAQRGGHDSSYQTKAHVSTSYCKTHSISSYVTHDLSYSSSCRMARRCTAVRAWQGSPGSVCVGDGAAVDANTRGKDVHTAAIVGEACHLRLDVMCTHGHSAGRRSCRGKEWQAAHSSRTRSVSFQAEYVIAKSTGGLLLTLRHKVCHRCAGTTFAWVGLPFHDRLGPRMLLLHHCGLAP
jgi:hypothetical protein